MLSRGLWRTTSFRLSAVYGALYAAGILLLLGLVYLQTTDYLVRRSDRILAAGMRTLETSGADGILAQVRRGSAQSPLTRYALYSGQGQRIAGDSALTPDDLPLDGLGHDAPPEPDEPASRAMAERAPWGEILIVQRDTRQVVEFRRIILTALLLSGFVIAVLGLALGAVLGLAPLRRIQEIRAASEAIGAGDFSLRLPVTPAGDEIDELAAIANRMMDEAERLLGQARSVGEGVAHELRSPMTRLRARLEHAAEDLRPDDPRRGLLEGCIAEADAVLGRFRALLRIAALEARGRRIGLQPVRLDELAGQVGELYEPLAAERGLALSVDAPTPITVEADQDLLFEAVCNLVDNALKFTPAGGHVQVSARAAPAGVALEVADDGPGIPASERALVTKRFWRSPRHAGCEGYGLGLSLVAAVADLHGFALRFEDASPGTRARLICGA